MPSNNWNTTLYDQNHAFVFEYGKGLLPLLNPQSGERILDLGCGTGHLTKSIADAGAHVVGIDSSVSMTEAARSAYPELEFQVADARNFSFSDPFDAIFSNATLHWVIEAEQAVQSIANALKPGGRFVAEFGGKGNVHVITTAAQQALKELAGIKVNFGWYFPSIGEYTPLLEKYGLAVQSAMLFDRPTLLEGDEQGLRNWIQMFGNRVFTNVSEEVKEQVLRRVEEIAHASLFKDGHWFADYRRIRIVAYKER